MVMNIKSLISCIISILLICGCQKTDALVGEWHFRDHDSTRMIFFKNGKFDYILNGAKVNDNGNNKYLVYVKNNIKNENWVEVYDENKELYFRFKYEIDACNLLVAFYKEGKNISNDIDEFGILKRIDCLEKTRTPETTQILVLPEGYLGDIYLIFSGESEQMEPSMIYKVPDNGILYIPYKTHPFDILRDGIKLVAMPGDTIQMIVDVKNSKGNGRMPNNKYAKIRGYNHL